MYKWSADELKYQIGKLFQLYRLRNKLSQLQLGHELNLSANHIGRIERAETNPTVEIVLEYCNFFLIDISILFVKLTDRQLDDIEKEINNLKIENKNQSKKS
ncbi:XRE family transcriptional regulator [Kaistella daneshvariae]|uniref:XRE family transcriptional regulator n=1 Tax=Kaistella daneshvariae TaxID=2487074 RepID=A0ABM7C6L3_9FLAO|nr:helix-turn-helix transcriptional regulator [Kaistella daneshvariae]AZI66606.1 XRE family transcriptional regulator [Kaistella daneshvariae]